MVASGVKRVLGPGVLATQSHQGCTDVDKGAALAFHGWLQHLVASVEDALKRSFFRDDIGPKGYSKCMVLRHLPGKVDFRCSSGARPGYFVVEVLSV